MEFDIVQYAYSLIGRVPFFDGVAIFFAQYFPYVLIIAFIFFIFMSEVFGGGMSLLVKKRRAHFVLRTLLAILLAWGVLEPIIHYVYARPRPFVAFGWTPLVSHAADPSFPSGHALFFFALATSVWLASKKWGWWFFAAAGLIAVARVYTLLHFPTDVIFGALIGSAVAYAVHRLVPSVQ